MGPAEDMKLGFHQVFKHYYMPSLHEPAVVVELLINGKVWEKLTPSSRRSSRPRPSRRPSTPRSRSTRPTRRRFAISKEKHNVQIGRTPNDILIGILKVWDKIAQQESDKNPFFKKVWESQRRWAADVVFLRRTVHPAYEVGADYYWPQK